MSKLITGFILGVISHMLFVDFVLGVGTKDQGKMSGVLVSEQAKAEPEQKPKAEPVFVGPQSHTATMEFTADRRILMLGRDIFFEIGELRERVFAAEAKVKTLEKWNNNQK